MSLEQLVVQENKERLKKNDEDMMGVSLTTDLTTIILVVDS